MFDTNKLGYVGEVKAMSKFAENGFTVFIPLSDAIPIDFIAYKNDKMFRVQVKSTSSKTKYDSYPVKLQTIQVSTTKITYKNMDTSKFDILSVYIEPLDKVCFVKSSELTNVSRIHFREFPTKHANKRKQWIISEYLNL